MSKSYMTIQRMRLLVGLLTLAAWPTAVLAQNYDNPGLGELPVTARPQGYKPLGWRAGGIMLHAGAQLAAEIHDNVW